MDAPDMDMRVRVVETLRRLRQEVADLDALVGCSAMLVDDTPTTLEDEDDATAASRACRLLAIAMRQIEYIGSELDDEIAKVETETLAAMAESEPSTPAESDPSTTTE